MAIVSGSIRNETGGPALGATVRAFDKDLRHEQLLGEMTIAETSGRYEISYTADRFRRAEKKSADLIVRAFDREGNLRAESEIRFNARDNERVDLTFGPAIVPERSRQSELEQLQDSIEPAREGVAYHEFTDSDLSFLTEEALRVDNLGGLERRVVRERLGFVRLASQFSLQTNIKLDAFYGWFRRQQPQRLETLFDVSPRVLRQALVNAIRDRIIPDITAQLDEILELVELWNLEQRRVLNHRFVVQLLNDQTSEPLSGYFVAVADPAAASDERELGTVVTDERGACEIVFSLPGDASTNATRRLQLTIADQTAEIAELTIDAHANQQEVAVLRVPLPENTGGAIPIGEATSPALAARLRQRGILSLNDLLAHPEVEDGDNEEELARLRAAAKFAVLSPELRATEREQLLSRGYRSLLDVGGASRAAFVRDTHEDLGGDANTFVTNFAARETGKVLYHMIGSAWLKQVTSPDDEPEDPDIPTGVNDVLSGFTKCGCKDCSSAVSPTAYLAHLLEWTLSHIRDGEVSIAFPQLAEEFHQPFGDLPASCAAVEEQVQQVRIAVEVLWRFTDFLIREDLQLPSSFRTSYRHLRNQLYRLILNKLGTSFEQLRTATLQVAGDSLTASLVAKERQAVADLLGIDQAHLNGLFFNIEQPPISPSEADLERRFGFRTTRAEDVFVTPETPDLINWQRERLDAIWESQDWSVDAFAGEERLPFIDPVVIDEAYLRAPLDSNPGLALLEARRQALAEHRQSMIDLDPQQNGLAQLLENELNQTIEQLRALYATIQTDQAADALQAQETIASLNLTAAGFIHLMAIDERLEADQPLGTNEEEINAAWEAVFDILSRAHRHTLFPNWVAEENDLDLIFGPRIFWLPVDQPFALNAWQASTEERRRWEEALGHRSHYPVIDPDQIRLKDLTIFKFLFLPGVPLNALLHLPPFVTVTLWQQRRAWIDDRLDALRTARQGQPNTSATLQALLEATTLGIDLTVFADLADLEAGGQDPRPRLRQLGLTTAEFRFLARIHQLAVANASVGSATWQEVDAILVQAEKRLEFAAWRAQEQANGITLHPQRFEAPEDFKPDDSPQARWLHNPAAFRQWITRLQARVAQREALDQALARAVDEATEIVLPLLRNILIMQSSAPGDSLDEKADWLDRRLLVDMRMDGCQMTSRVSQAIETLQRFIRGVYTQEHLDLMQHLTLDAEEDYQTDWPVIGSYATWRAYMLVYLYPENLLHLTPPPRQTSGFTQLKKNLPSRVDPAHACAAAQEYSSYFQDVFHLEAQASCQVRTRVDSKGGCGATTGALRSLVHVFALATNSGRVYANSFDAYFDTKDTLNQWQPVPKLANVVEIIGAVPHETLTQQRLILLFVKVRELSRTSLEFVSFDLDKNSWSKAKAGDLDLPPGAGDDFSAVAVQKRHGSMGETLVAEPSDDSLTNESLPTILAIRVPGGKVYVRSLNSAAMDWSGSEWVPLFGELKAETISNLCALVQRSRDEYLMVVEGHDGWLHYRIFSVEPVISRDDGLWRGIIKGKFRGAFVLPNSPDVAVFYQKAGAMRYKIVGETAALIPAGWPSSTIVALNAWLVGAAGVTLEDYSLDLTADAVLDHWPKQETEGANCSFSDLEFGVRYIGNLLHLLTLTEPTWDLSLPDLNLAEESCLEKPRSEYKQEILDSLQSMARESFTETVKRASSASFQDSELGHWKLADWYVRQFSQHILPGVEVGLVAALANAFLGNDDVTFRLRGDEIGEAKPLFQLKQAHIVPSGGDEDSGPTPRKIVVFRKSNGSFRQKLKRTGNSLSPATSRIRLTPLGDGPFDLTPLAAKEDLQTRRLEIREMYEAAGLQASLRLYLKEAYNLVPAYLAYELQRNRHYEEALLWYRQVYDYLQPKNKRKIDHGLKLEAELGVSYEDAEEWLSDAGNAHAIAATRKNTYTRHILLMIVRCLIDFGDTLFSRDNVTDNTRARELYTIALRLLEDLGALKPGSASCANIIGELEIDVVEQAALPLQQFKMALMQIQDPDSLRNVVDSIRTINQETARPAIERISEMRDAVVAAIDQLPAAKRLTNVVETKRQTIAALEDQFLSAAPGRTLLINTQQHRREHALAMLAHVTETSEESLLQPTTELSWLRQPRTNADEEARPAPLELALFNPSSSRRLAVLSDIKRALPMPNFEMLGAGSFAINTGISFDFCIPQNPLIQALKIRAVNNLAKLRSCRNIAGFLRPLDPYGAPIGIGAGMVSPDGSIFSGVVDAPPTIYRFFALISRAKELVVISQQIEAGYQSALESAEREALTLLQAEQNVELAGARVTLQDLRVNQANMELGLAQIQKSSAVLRESTFADWIASGVSEYENKTLEAYRDAGDAQEAAARANAIGQAANAAMSALPKDEGILGAFTIPTRVALASVVAGAAIAEGVYNVQAIRAGTSAQINSTLASFERREEQWRLEQGLAALDVQISDQQIELAKGQIDIVEQERVIAALEQTHAVDVLNFLLSKDFTEEMYRWIASVLQDVYRFFLQEATAIARVAERQLAFERQQGPLKVIQTDYWDMTNTDLPGAGADRLGLTASARLLKDIYQLDNYAFETRQRKQSLTLTLDLAAMFPIEFQRFRETGVLIFETGQDLIDRQMPGYYLCLIQQVSVSVVALIPPALGIRATLTSAGVSRVVVGGDTFQIVTIRNLPERMAMTAATTASSEIVLEPDSQSLLKPFEGTGFDTLWELRMPKASNPFDYDTIATVLFTVSLTALHSFDYEREVIERLDRTVTFERAFDFRQVFADAWYDLNNPDQTSTPMIVRFETRRSDFPANLANLAIQHVVLYLVRKDGELFEQPIRHLHFTGPGMPGPVGGTAATVNGRVSTRSGNGVNWLSMIGQEPQGVWELAFPDQAPSDAEARERFTNGLIENLLLVLTVSGQSAPIPG